MTQKNLGGRPKKWNSPLFTLKVPVEDVELLKALTYALHLDRDLESKLRTLLSKKTS